jgi:hypothetical protein
VLKRGDRDATSVFDALSRFPQWANAADVNTSAAITLTATSTDVESSIESSLNAMDVRDGDWLIFYVSAHGGTPTRTGDETPVTIDGAENSADELIQLGSSLISDDDLTNLFDNEKWQNVNKLFLISACHSGGFVGDDLTSDTGDLENLDHVAVLASSTEEGTSFYRDTTGQCIWTTDALLPNLTSGMTVADLVASMAAAEEGIRAAYIGQEFGLSDMYAPGSTGVFEYQPLNHVSDDIPLNVALPEPATLTFLTLGGLAILRRRRKR